MSPPIRAVLGALAVILLSCAAGSIMLFFDGGRQQARCSISRSRARSRSVASNDAHVSAHEGARGRRTRATRRRHPARLHADLHAGHRRHRLRRSSTRCWAATRPSSRCLRSWSTPGSSALSSSSSSARSTTSASRCPARPISACSCRFWTKYTFRPVPRGDRSLPDLVAGEPGDRAGRLIQATDRPDRDRILIIYLVIALVIAAIKTALAGA